MKLICMYSEITMSGAVPPHSPVFLRCKQECIFVGEDAYFVETII
jgi:hypothetical protein